jgi:mannose-6-phosphate isomerase-like protein (cupin superfamily)
MSAKFKLREAGPEWVNEVENNLTFQTLLDRTEYEGAVSITRVRINGNHRSLITNSSLRIYMLIEGEIEFTVEKESGIKLRRGSVLTLESGVTYSLNGSGEYFVINVPAFKSQDDVYL